jgi:hypothetical protein
MSRLIIFHILQVMQTSLLIDFLKNLNGMKVQLALAYGVIEQEIRNFDLPL